MTIQYQPPRWLNPECAPSEELCARMAAAIEEFASIARRVDDFVAAMREVKRILQRDGAVRWGLFVDPAQPTHYLETFLVESWAEHMRQHARVTMEDRIVQDRARSFHVGPDEPVVTHLIARDLSKGDKRNKD